MDETSPCNVDAEFSGVFQQDSSTAITPVFYDFANYEVHSCMYACSMHVCKCATNICIDIHTYHDM